MNYEKYKDLSWVQLVEMVVELQDKVKRLEEANVSRPFWPERPVCPPYEVTYGGSKSESEYPKISFVYTSGYQGPYGRFAWP